MTSEELKERHKKRDPALVRAREQRIWTWILEGRSTTWIAEKEQVKPPTISRIKRRVMERIDEEVIAPSVQRVRNVQIAKARRVQSESWDAWERSKGHKHRTKQRQQPIANAQGPNTTVNVLENAVEQRDGNPAFLDRFMAAVELENRLTGADMPIKIAPTSPDGASAYVPESPEARRSRIFELVQLAATRARGALGPVIDITPTQNPATT